MITRRDSIRLGAAALAVAGPAAWTRAEEAQSPAPTPAPKRKIPVAIASMTIDRDLLKDLPAAMKKVAGAGLTGVEFSYNFSRHLAQEVAKALADNGLTAVGACGTLDAKSFEKTADYYKQVGCKSLIAGGPFKPQDKTAAPWLEFAKQLNAWQEKLTPLGMRTGYHNHPSDFTAVEDGRIPWEIVFENTVAEVVMELDVGNTPKDASQAILKKFPGRAKLIHLKDLKGWGKGTVNFPEVFELCETVGGTEWYVIEQYGGGTWETRIGPCLEYLRERGRL
jgi:sugar phosphate isomerase/epimerase